MATEETKAAEKAEKTTKTFDAQVFDRMAKEYRTALGPEAQAKIIADNPDLHKEGIFLARRFERTAMPIYAQTLGRLEENTVYDKVRLVRDGLLTVVAGWVGWQGIKWVRQYFKAP